jgi:putative ABC transport system permease protein
VNGPPPIDLWQLGLALAFVLLAGCTSLWLKLGLGKDLLVATLRTFAQLYLMGYLLLHIFELRIPWLVLLIFGFMIFFAARIVWGRVKSRGIGLFKPVLISMLLSYGVITYVVVDVIIQADPWWEPRYFLPMGGMVAGNSMNAIALALERLFAEAKNRRDQIELMLTLGADYREATAEIFSEAVRAGMIPSINAMMAVGVVFLPGMMTGQILGGNDPITAIKYQIVVMLMIVGSAAMGSVMAVLLARKRLFNRRVQLMRFPS